MATGKNLKFMTCGESSLEYRVAVAVLMEHGLGLHNIDYHLTHDTDEELDEFMELQVREGIVCFLPSMPLERFKDKPYMEKVTILKPQNIPGKMSVLGQICAIVGHQPTRYESLVSVFAVSHIQGMYAAGALKEEVKQIALRDRLSRGGTLQDECLVAEYANKLWAIRRDGDAVTHEMILKHGEKSILTTPEGKRTLIDHVLCEAGGCEMVSIILDQMSEDYRIMDAEMLTTSQFYLEAAHRIAKRYRFIMTTPTREKRSKMFSFHLVPTDKTRQVVAFRDLLRRYRPAIP